MIRGLAMPLATYRTRRRQALKAVEAAFQARIPLLVFGAPWSDPVKDLCPVAGKHRQDPWFDWLCGCHEGGAVLLLDPNDSKGHCLFLERGDPAKVVWDGARLQPTTATRRAFGVHQCLPMEHLQEAIGKAAAAAEHKLAMLWRDIEPGQQSLLAGQWKKKLRGIKVVNAEKALTPLRMIKDAHEIAYHRKAIAITEKGLKATLAEIPKLKTEAAVAGALIGRYTAPAYEHLAFAPIVGSGINGATLHYKYNDGPLLAKKPVLIDSGATAGGYCADVTRTVPQHGRFDNKRFREVYELVLKCNALGRKHAQPGITLAELNEIAWAPIIEAGFTRHHGLSHHIGMDVHDVSDRSAPLAAGMIISNEPGIYLPNEGFGVRIEDDLLITDSGCEDMTKAIPKTVKALEKLMGH